jgi:hypothetical protein
MFHVRHIDEVDYETLFQAVNSILNKHHPHPLAVAVSASPSKRPENKRFESKLLQSYVPRGTEALAEAWKVFIFIYI